MTSKIRAMAKRGKFIVLDGVDGSGKATQAYLLVKKLKKKGIKVKKIDFPNYAHESAYLLKEYLKGKFGTADEVGPYRASIFYAVDRYVSAQKINNWLGQDYVVIADRYVSSNKGHQAGKIQSKEGRKKFLDWINELEYKIFEIPIPDLTVLLYVPSEIGAKLIKKRNFKRDIHEADKEHLKSAERTYLEMARGLDKIENWQIINCHARGMILDQEKINEQIYGLLKQEKIISK